MAVRKARGARYWLVNWHRRLLTYRRKEGALPIPPRTQTPEEAEEIRAVLSSVTFSGSPNLARLLKYLFDHHFSEENSGLNEYRIGVEALGRSTDFDAATNSSVRVLMHRLRSKLRKYYETEGANHPLRIILEDGHYGLHFVRPGDGLAASASESQGLKSAGEEPGVNSTRHNNPSDKPSVAGDSVERRERSRIRFGLTKSVAIAGAVVMLAVVSVWILIGARPLGRFAHTPIAFPPSGTGIATGATTEAGPILILAGYMKGKYVDRAGKVWGGDRFFKGGEAGELRFPFIQGTEDPTIYRTGRFGEFSYDIPANPGKYELRLHFAETMWGPGTVLGRGEASRIFSVFLGGRTLLSDFDVLSNAGGNNLAYTKIFRDVSAGGDGKIHLRFERQSDLPFVNAIELVPEVRGRVSPVRIVMQESSFVDHAGRFWEPDRYASGGVLAAHRKVEVQAPDPHLFDGERYGHFIYQIPVAQGRYTVTLYFTETFFGTDQVYSGADDDRARPDHRDARVFDVYANGVALLRNFDILKIAGGPNKPVTGSFHGIEPNAAGLIVLSFVPVKNYACVNAIEVTDESP